MSQKLPEDHFRIPEDYFEKFQTGQLTDGDRQLFQQWMRQATPEQMEQVVERFGSFFETQADNADELVPANFSARIEQRVDAVEASQHRFNWNRTLSAAAAIVGFIFVLYLFFKKPQQIVKQTELAKQTQIVPGSNKAVLTLSNGATILLDDARNGVLAKQGKVQVVKTANGKVVYTDGQDAQATADANAFNTIATPRGGQYQLLLPDGSKVWLNAATSLRYPVHFAGTERRVELDGEAYFEVAKDKQHPFIVHVNNNEVRVLGTHFNVMAYKDEAAMRTTLLEGSVQVSGAGAQRVIVPGEQAVVGAGIKVMKVNAAEAVEWKNGNFNFSHEKLPVIMRKIARWYNVDISYEGKTTAVNFVGTIPRSENITEVLKYLQLTELVHFNITERRVTVMP